MSSQRLTTDLLAVHTGTSRGGYTTELESECGSVYAGDENGSTAAPIVPSSTGTHASSHNSITRHDPYARSSATLRGALAALGESIHPTRPRGPTKPKPSSEKYSTRQPFFGREFARMDPFQRHKRMAEEYIKYYGGKASDMKPVVASKTDSDILRENYRFVRSTEDDIAAATGSAEQRLAKKYYDRLFKEYALADMTHYKTGRIGLRWRTENEVISGRGQFTCGNKKCNSNTTELKSFELNFAYVEGGQNKQALVKVRLCTDCSYLLHYPKIKQIEVEEKERRKREKDMKREKRRDRKRERSSSSSSSKKSKKRPRGESDSDSSSDSGSDGDSTSPTAGGRPAAKKARTGSSPTRVAILAAASSSPTSAPTSASSSSAADPVDSCFREFASEMFP